VHPLNECVAPERSVLKEQEIDELGACWPVAKTLVN
jgi:hypothetical protein